MPKTYSSDLRERLTAAVTAGMSRNEAADVFSVAISTAVKWMQRLRDTGSWEAKPRGGGTSPLEQHKERILAVVSERPDATLKEILAALRKQGIHTSKSALDRFLARHKITRKKKSLRAAEQKRKDVARARRKWIREQGLLDPAKLVFIDETSVNTNMVRLYGRFPCGSERPPPGCDGRYRAEASEDNRANARSLGAPRSDPEGRLGRCPGPVLRRSRGFFR
jgi:transposase